MHTIVLFINHERNGAKKSLNKWVKAIFVFEA